MDHVDLSEGMTDIDVVVTGRAQCYELNSHSIQLVDYFSVDIVVDKHADNLATLCQVRRILVQLCLQKLEFNIMKLAVFLKRWPVIGLCIIKSD